MISKEAKGGNQTKGAKGGPKSPKKKVLDIFIGSF